METLEEKLVKVEHGFKLFQSEAEQIVHSHTLPDAKVIALDLMKNKHYQVRCCALFILGALASGDHTVLTVLKNTARTDESWQVQEIIAKAFDRFCADNGYEKSLPYIAEWLDDQHPNVCRAVTEGLRIWTSRPYFTTHPELAIRLISDHKASESEYLRKSVGNALRDISKKHGELIRKEISSWDLTNKHIAFTHAYVLKKH